jgi:hypothetical protein
MKAYLFIIILIVVVILLSCNDNETPVTGHNWPAISGTIIDSADSTPLESAIISIMDTIDSYSVNSDSLGTYLIPANDSSVLYVRRSGHITQSKTLIILNDSSNVDFKLIKE